MLLTKKRSSNTMRLEMINEIKKGQEHERDMRY
jgi:hypothetical protein